GVVHSAFVMADGALPAMSVDRLAAALRPKLDGTAAIAEAFADSGLDFLALLSSTVATTATAGQANYAAAAMAQDAAGRWLGRDGGLPVRTIGWGFWGEVGRVADEVHRNRLRGTGVAAIGTEEGIDALLAVLGAGWPAVSVLKLADDAPARASTASDVAPAALRDLVIGTLAAVLELRAEEVADGDELAAIGLDSIGMVDVQERLESGLSALPSTLLAGVRTVGELVARVAAHASGTPAAAPPQCAEAIAIRGAGTGTPGFWVPSFIGEAGWVRHLADAFGTTRPTWLLRPGDVAAAPNLAAVGAALADAVAAVHAGGPVILGGYSYGGVLAVDAAAILRARGVPVERVVLLDSFAPGSSALSATLDAGEPPDLPVAVASVLARGWGLRAPIAADGTDIAHLADAVRAACDTAPPAAEVVRLIEADLAAIRRMRVLLRDHRPDAGAGGLPVTLLRARRAPDAGGSAMPLDAAAAAVFRADGADDHGWSTWLGVAPEIVPVDADHFGLGEPAVLAVLARHLAGGSRRDAVLDVVRRHTVAVLAGVSPEAVTLDVSLRDLGANSIDRVEIATLAMAELDADIPRRRLAAVSDLASLVDLLVEFSAAP
ncbi:MAG: KR domain-containing protein, partial [Alphaproteobacteria bacterium]